MHKLPRMHRRSNRATGPAVTEATPPLSATQHTAERRIVVLGTILPAIALAYSQASSHHYLATRPMTLIFQYLLRVEDPKTAWLTFGVCAAAAFWKNPVPL